MPSVWQPWKVATTVSGVASVCCRNSGSGASTWSKNTWTSPKCSSKCAVDAGQAIAPADTPSPRTSTLLRSR